jgi:hypothetical protein
LGTGSRGTKYRSVRHAKIASIAKSADEDVLGVIDQFVDDLVIELLLDDSVETESQSDIDDGRDAIEGKDHEESEGAAPVPLDEEDPEERVPNRCPSNSRREFSQRRRGEIRGIAPLCECPSKHVNSRFSPPPFRCHLAARALPQLIKQATLNWRELFCAKCNSRKKLENNLDRIWIFFETAENSRIYHNLEQSHLGSLRRESY